MWRQLNENNRILTFDDAHMTDKNKRKITINNMGRLNVTKIEISSISPTSKGISISIRTGIITRTSYDRNDIRNDLHFTTKIRVSYSSFLDEEDLKQLEPILKFKAANIKYHTLQGADKGHQRFVKYFMESGFESIVRKNILNLIKY